MRSDYYWPVAFFIALAFTWLILPLVWRLLDRFWYRDGKD